MHALGRRTEGPKDAAAVVRQLERRLAERMLTSELTKHLGYAPGAEEPAEQTNYGCGTGASTVLTEIVALPIDVPRDRPEPSRAAVAKRNAAAPAVRRERAPAMRASRVGVRELDQSRAALAGRGLLGDDQCHDGFGSEAGESVVLTLICAPQAASTPNPPRQESAVAPP